MSYEQIKNLRPSEFKRFCGVKPERFQVQALVLAFIIPLMVTVPVKAQSRTDFDYVEKKCPFPDFSTLSGKKHTIKSPRYGCDTLYFWLGSAIAL